MTVFSGRYGNIGSCSQLANWSCEVTMSDNAQSNSYTRGAKMRDEGIRDWTGSATYLGTSFPGTYTLDNSFAITLNSGSPTWSGSGMTLTGNAVWTSIAVSGDISSGGRVQCAISFAGDGQLTSNSSGSGKDTTTPTILLAKDCVVTFDTSNGGTATTLAWKSFNFTINHEVQELVDSTCAIASTGTSSSKVVWKKRYPGIIDCTGTIDWVSDTEPSTQNSLGELKIMCGSTVILKADPCRYMGMSGYTVDPSSGALVGGTSNFSFCAHDDSGNIGDLQVYGTSLFPPSGGSTTTS